MRRSLVLLAMLIVIAGCQDQQRSPHVQSETGNAVARPVSVSATPAKHLTPSPTPTPTPTSTATHTLTPTPTPTPTPTAQPMTVDGSPRLAAVAQHSTLEGTGCQLVDLFDFPLNPPDGDGVARGGTDFGVYRSRYEQYHTGEDWWVSRGSGSFGAPVYSIGHGRVTYAAPLGWGRDQGVVIIRHTFDDGRQLLSFYGHLDPPSVSLSQGECVSRGQQIGSIGRPRTPPHLHFEIRTIMPDEPGGGYWWQDPTLAGWLPPSQTIWQVRLLASPGAEWLRAPQNRNSIAIGLHNERLYLLLEDQQLIGLDITSGEPRWSAALEERLEAAALDLADPTLYVADQLGRVTAFRLPDAGDYPEVGQVEGTLESLWKVDLDVVGIPQLIPLPGGGMMIVVWDEIIGLSPDGEVLWQRDSVDRPYEWLATGDQLLISTVGGEHSLWVLDSSGPRPWPGLGGGALAGQGEHVYLFNDAGLYGLNPADGSSRLISDWPSDSLRASDVMALEDGGALIAYVGRRDRRLVRFDMTGAIIWQRALPDELPGVPQFLETGDQPYLIATGVSDGTATVSLYAIDLNNAVLVHLFEGGTRTPQPNSDSVHLLGGNRLLLNIGGGHLVSLDLQQAAEAIVIASDSLPQ